MHVKLSDFKMSNAHETIKPTEFLSGNIRPGDFVAIRPCDKEYNGKTFLGMYLCSAPTSVIGEQVGEEIILQMTNYINPAIYVPELGKIIWGYNSWWGQIESEDHLREITNDDIEKIWYVRALKAMYERVENNNV